ncbi:MAG TPA: DUF4956 domain-containing protein [Thermodesulfobacteriota bacterium]|nr:DUF4956 domain-containing protein [Thermodesulfobacteriota bacterium]
MDGIAGVMGNIGSSEFGLAEFLVSILFSLCAGVICMLLYRVYFGQAYERNDSLTRSFVVIAPSVSAIFWAIQYSLPLSLGLLGALSFVRFRTPIKKAEDIAFILLVIAMSLLSSVFRFYAAGILLAVVALVVCSKVLLSGKGLPFLNVGRNLTAFISTTSRKVEKIDSEIRKILSAEFDSLRGGDLVLNDVVQKGGGYSLRYSFHLGKYNDTVIPRLIETLNRVDDLERVEVFYGKVGG